MTSFTEQLSAVRQSQWEAQLDMFHRLSTRALDSTGQLIALNLKASRASMDQAAGTIKHFFEAKDPRDLFALGSAAQGQWHQMFDYSRELLGIATGASNVWSTLPAASLPAPLIPAPTANIPVTPAQAVEQAAIATAVVSGQVEAEFEKTVEAAIADDVPPAKAKPLAQALNEVAPKPASVEHPIASTLPLEANGEVELPAVAPVEHTPAPVKMQTQAPEPKPGRGARKK